MSAVGLFLLSPSRSEVSVWTAASRLLPRLPAQNQQMAPMIASGPTPPNTAPMIAPVLGFPSLDVLSLDCAARSVGLDVCCVRTSIRIEDDDRGEV